MFVIKISAENGSIFTVSSRGRNVHWGEVVIKYPTRQKARMALKRWECIYMCPVKYKAEILQWKEEMGLEMLVYRLKMGYDGIHN